jgi:hypothetical protein
MYKILLILCLFIYGCNVSVNDIGAVVDKIKENKDKEQLNNNEIVKPEVKVDSDIEIIIKWTTPKEFMWNWRKPEPDKIKNAPVNIEFTASKNYLSYIINNFNGISFPQYDYARLETYTFNKNGELYVWKDWGVSANGSVDGRWIKSEDGWSDGKERDGLDLEDFDAIIVHKNEQTGEVYARSKVFHKSDLK